MVDSTQHIQILKNTKLNLFDNLFNELEIFLVFLLRM